MLFASADEPVPLHTWYQRRQGQHPQVVHYRWERETDWRWAAEGQVPIVGPAIGTRTADFLQLAQTADFTLFLAAEPENPVNPHARRVMACGTVQAQRVTACLGYLPDDLATKYAGIELAIRPSKALFPPTADQPVRLEIALLLRSAGSFIRPQRP